MGLGWELFSGWFDPFLVIVRFHSVMSFLVQQGVREGFADGG